MNKFIRGEFCSESYGRFNNNGVDGVTESRNIEMRQQIMRDCGNHVQGGDIKRFTEDDNWRRSLQCSSELLAHKWRLDAFSNEKKRIASEIIYSGKTASSKQYSFASDEKNDKHFTNSLYPPEANEQNARSFDLKHYLVTNYDRKRRCFDCNAALQTGATSQENVKKRTSDYLELSADNDSINQAGSRSPMKMYRAAQDEQTTNTYVDEFRFKNKLENVLTNARQAMTRRQLFSEVYPNHISRFGGYRHHKTTGDIDSNNAKSPSKQTRKAILSRCNISITDSVNGQFDQPVQKICHVAHNADRPKLSLSDTIVITAMESPVHNNNADSTVKNKDSLHNAGSIITQNALNVANVIDRNESLSLKRKKTKQSNRGSMSELQDGVIHENEDMIDDEDTAYARVGRHFVSDANFTAGNRRRGKKENKDIVITHKCEEGRENSMDTTLNYRGFRSCYRAEHQARGEYGALTIPAMATVTEESSDVDSSPSATKVIHSQDSIVNRRPYRSSPCSSRGGMIIRRNIATKTNRNSKCLQNLPPENETTVTKDCVKDDFQSDSDSVAKQPDRDSSSPLEHHPFTDSNRVGRECCADAADGAARLKVVEDEEESYGIGARTMILRGDRESQQQLVQTVRDSTDFRLSRLAIEKNINETKRATRERFPLDGSVRRSDIGDNVNVFDKDPNCHQTHTDQSLDLNITAERRLNCENAFESEACILSDDSKAMDLHIAQTGASSYQDDRDVLSDGIVIRCAEIECDRDKVEDRIKSEVNVVAACNKTFNANKSSQTNKMGSHIDHKYSDESTSATEICENPTYSGNVLSKLPTAVVQGSNFVSLLPAKRLEHPVKYYLEYVHSLSQDFGKTSPDFKTVSSPVFELILRREKFKSSRDYYEVHSET